MGITHSAPLRIPQANDTEKNGPPPLNSKKRETHIPAYYEICLSYGQNKIIAPPNTNTPTKAPNAIAISIIAS